MSDPSVPAHYDELLDTSGLNCPLPLLKTKQSLNTLTPGQVLKVIATDAGSWRDIPVFINNSVNELLHAEHDQDQYRYWIKKGNRE
jgi:TusA-related sulfurtransferase